jgi:hypothetical protein
MANVFGNQLAAGVASRKRQANVLGGAAASGIRAPSRMISYLNGQRALLANPNTTMAANPPGLALAPAGLLSDFRFASAPADGMDAPSRFRPVLPDRDEHANVRVPINRVLYALPHGSPLQLPGHDELAIVKKSMPRHRNIRLTDPTRARLGDNGLGRLIQSGYTDSYAAGNMGRNMLIQGEPVRALNIQAWNFCIAQKLLELFKTDRARYNALGIHELWFGTDGGHDVFNPKYDKEPLDCCGWSVDGIPRVEELSDGRSARDNDGYSWAASHGGIGTRPTRPAESAKKVTMIAAGSQHLIDYGGGRGMCEGGLAHLVLSRQAVPVTSGRTATYTLAHKSGPLGIPAGGATMTLEVPDKAEATAENPDPDLYDFRPPQLSWVMSPDGSALDPGYQENVDERGFTHYDAIILRLGRIMWAPDRFTYRLPPGPGELRPMTNGYELMVQPKCVILLDPCKDGAFGIL